MKLIAMKYLVVSLVLCLSQRVQGKCDPLCGTGVYHSAGTCQPSGKCLCFWGWTGPKAQYTTNNTILADYCRVPCHYTPDYKNPLCVNSSYTGKVCKVPSSMTPSTPCDPKCGVSPYTGRGRCLSNGRCLCWWGWTGPSACYVDDGKYENRIIADYCGPACTYTPDYRNPKCLNNSWSEQHNTSVPTPFQTTRVETTKEQPTEVATTQIPCDPLCGTGVYHEAGKCQMSGRCLCAYGWTGPHAKYTAGNRILADYCRIPCHYTHDHKNPLCVNSSHTGEECKVPPSMTPSTPCDPKCGKPPYYGRGQCLSNGRCLCWWGWTGPSACYVEDGYYENRLIADYCVAACHYTPIVRNATCLNGTWPDTKVITKKAISAVQNVGPLNEHSKQECVLPSIFHPKVRCDPRCGDPQFSTNGRGRCLRNGRCLCWWGWTGPNACIIKDGGDFHNRIIANYCEKPCSYSPHIRAASCLTERGTEKTELDEQQNDVLQL